MMRNSFFPASLSRVRNAGSLGVILVYRSGGHCRFQGGNYRWGGGGKVYKIEVIKEGEAKKVIGESGVYIHNINEIFSVCVRVYVCVPMSSMMAS